MRVYVKKTDRASWTNEELSEAIDAVISGKSSVRKAGKDFHIPEATLRDYLMFVVSLEKMEKLGFGVLIVVSGHIRIARMQKRQQIIRVISALISDGL